MKGVFVPPPIDGINKVTPPTQLRPTEARDLENYFIYDWGIRERGASEFTAFSDQSVTGPTYMESFTGLTQPGTLISTGAKVLRYDDDETFTTLETQSTNQFYNACQYKKKIFCPQPQTATAKIGVYDTVAETWSSTSFTLGSVKPSYCFVFKDRIYVLDATSSPGTGSATVYYGAVGAVTGSFDGSFDVSEFFERGRKLTWGTQWSYNEGDRNASLFVVGNDAGEVFIYSGDYPAADNWYLVTRVTIPTPLNSLGTLAAQADYGNVKPLVVGQDVLINTVRGVVSLARVVSGREQGESYYSLSRNLGPVLQGYTPSVSYISPFAYFLGEDSAIYVLNYERGAWSRLSITKDSTDGVLMQVTCSTTPSTVSSSNALSSYLLIAEKKGTTGSYGIHRINESDLVADSSASYKWKTPFFDFGSYKQKHNKLVRVITRDIAETSVSNSVAISVDLDEMTVGNTDTKTDTVSDDRYTVQDLEPPGCGEYLSYAFSKTGSASAQNEIAGFRVLYEEGGVY